VKLLADSSGDLAPAALKALAASRFRSSQRDRIAKAVIQKSDPRLSETFDRLFP
jgi:hypothetical protein